MENALLVTIVLDTENSIFKPEEEALEFKLLATSAGVNIKAEIICHRHKPTPNYYVGEGKILEIKNICQQHSITTVMFNNDLTPTQQRNIEEILEIKTIDRTQLILEIFARHARTPEGKMQVELAQLEYLLPRLLGKGIILSRLGGGIGTRGPGEQKLEVDRRRIKERISRLKQDLNKLRKRRDTTRKKRKEFSLPSVTFVGYTSAGKSTLFNALVGASQPVSNLLFTTLDPLSRAIILSNNQKIILSDTVGFIYNLPPHLIEAFKATLEEITEADILIHVLDVSDLKVEQRYRIVLDILKDLAVENKPIITALNKIDLLKDRGWLNKYKIDFPDSVEVSALTKENLNILLEMIEKRLQKMLTLVKLKIPLNRMDLVNLIYETSQILDIKYGQDSIKIKANLPIVTTYQLKGYIND